MSGWRVDQMVTGTARAPRFPVRTASGMVVFDVSREDLVGLCGEVQGTVGSLGIELTLRPEQPGFVGVRTVRFGHAESEISTGELERVVRCLPELMGIAQAAWPKLWKVD